MKKFTGLLLAAVLCLPAYAAQTKNTMKMVSYFPVPYVAYDTVSANNAMDIGILNQCEMDINKGSTNLGGSACSLYLYGNATGADLNRGLLNVAAGKLDLNSNVTNARIVSKKVQIGKDMTTIGGWLDIGLPSGKAKDYDALYISSLKNTGSSFRVTSKENGAKVNSFHMFNEISNDFPGCAGTVTWKELELAADVDTNKTYTDVYLVCDGTGVNPPPDSVCTEGETRNGSRSCLGGCGIELERCKNGKWEAYNCVLKPGAECPTGYEQKTQCSDGKSFRIQRCNASCKFEEVQACPGLDCSNATYKASHKAECCPGTPTTDAVCWTQTYSWGPSKSIPVDTTVTYNAHYVLWSGADRCNSSKALEYQTVYPDIVNSSASSMVRCPGNDNASVKGKSCHLMYLGTGEPQDTYCFYSLGSGYEYRNGVGFRGCKLIEERNGDTCECTINAWPGHECVANEPQKNGW